MPGRNGTGPDGNGPTGFRGRVNGGCVGPYFPGQAGGFGRGRGNRRMARNRRMPGDGMGYGARWQNLPDYDTVAPVQANDNIIQELNSLKNAINNLNLALDEKQRMIDDLQQKLEQK